MTPAATASRQSSERPTAPGNRTGQVSVPLAAGIAVCIVLLLCVLISFLSTEPPDVILRQACEALDSDRFEEALQLAEQVLQEQPESRPALRVAADAAIATNQFETAIPYLEALIERMPDEARPDLLFDCGQCQLDLGRASHAERSFRRAMEIDPTHTAAREMLLLVLVSEARSWESLPLLLQFIQEGRINTRFLIHLSSLDIYNADDSGFIERCKAAVPDDPLPQFKLARDAIRSEQYDDAKQILRRILAVWPDQLAAQAWLGFSLASEEADAELVEWHHQLPAGARNHPLTWLAEGMWCARQEQHEAAARCFWEAVRRAPNHHGSVSRLAGALGRLGRADEADALAKRSQKLAQLRSAIDRAKFLSVPAMNSRVPGTLESLGRHVEAGAWYQLALENAPETAWAASGVQRVQQRLAGFDRRFLLPHVISDDLARLDLSDLPEPDWPTATRATDSPRSNRASSNVRFSDLATERNLAFTFQCDASPDDTTEYIFKFNGGGVGILDYDCDGWPDVYLTQGGQWPASEPSGTTAIDTLFRNGDGVAFDDITVAASLGDVDFSQGVTVGDFDNDGFPDLYVGNVTANRFYRNMGDGTFAEISVSSGTAGQRWTSSCALADLNGDTLPDLYVVNYLADDSLEGCPVEPGRMCDPTRFPAAEDEVFLNRGDGTFHMVTDYSDSAIPDSPGLGIVVADFDNSGRLSVFVANDGQANFFFANQGTPGGPLTFAEQALVTGMALGQNGRAQACMGVATDYINDDQQLDLFVTNFHREPNVLYLSDGPGLYVDGTRDARLRDSGIDMLGFGTQFLDADLDGDQDLIISNGHVLPFTSEVENPRMPAQFHINNSDGEFVLLKPESVGPYFSERHLGRVVARVDWNRDGREDVVVSHVDTPVALMTNQSDASHCVAFRLIGTESARDAIGTVVTITTDKGQTTRQLIAGDGYQCVNERRLVFGLGPAATTSIEDVRIRWPSGREQSWADLDADTEYVLIEGQQPVTLRRLERAARSQP